MGSNICHSLAVGTVCGNEKFVALTDHTGEDGLHTEGAAALHQDNCVFRFGYMSQFQKLAANTKSDFFVVIIPCAVVKKHLFFYGVCRGQRTWG